MTDVSPALAADRAFFAALLAADAPALERLLADEFILIDVMQGGEIPKAALVAAIGARQLTFESVETTPPRAQRHGNVVLVSGTTVMSGKFGADAWSARSRYLHVFVETAGTWRLVSAQGTQIRD